MKERYSKSEQTRLLGNYNQYLRERINKVRILGETNERNLQDVFVELKLSEQDTPQKQSDMMDTILSQRFDIFSEGKLESNHVFQEFNHKPKRYINPIEILEKRNRSLIVGDPGCGKSTLLKYLGLKAQEEKLLVIWIDLKTISKNSFIQSEKISVEYASLLQGLWIRQTKIQLSLNDKQIKIISDHWQEKLQKNEVAIILDGFDEIQDETIERGISKCINDFVSIYSEIMFLVSTRPYAKYKVGTENIRELEIEPLNLAQIEKFLISYYPDDKSLKNFLINLKNHPVRELARTPLLLGVILRLYKENRVTENRLELYKAILDILIRELDRSKSVTRQFQINNNRVRLDFLKFLAFERLIINYLNEEKENANPLVFSYNSLKQKAQEFLSREQLLYNVRDLVEDVLATSILREISLDSFAFSHFTLQEFLAADSLADLLQNDEIEGVRILCSGYHYPRIVETEVLPMLLGISDETNKLYKELEGFPESLTFANIRLRARGLRYGAKLDVERSNKLTENFFDIFWERQIESKPYFEFIANSFSDSPSIYLDPLIERIEVSLTNSYDYMRSKFADALGQIGGEKSVSVLHRILTDKVEYIREKAASWLGKIADENSVPTLIEALSNQDAEVIKAVAQSLVNLDPQKAANKFIELLQDKNNNLRSISIYWLGRLYGQSAINLVEKTLTYESRDVRLKVLEILGLIGGEKSLAILESFLEEEDFGIRLMALKAVGQSGGEAAINILLREVCSLIVEIRCEAIDGLVKIDSKRFLDVFINALQDDHPYVRWHAASALDLAADRRSLTALLEALEEENLSQIAGSHRGWVASRIIYALRHFKDDSVFRVLIEIFLNDHGSEAGESAAIVIAEIGGKRATQYLLDGLKRQGQSIRIGSAKGLGIIGDKDSAKDLIEVLKIGDNSINQYALEALGKIKNEIAVESLLLALQNSICSETATVALQNFQGKIFAQELIKCFVNKNEFVRRKAVSFVGYHSQNLSLIEEIDKLLETEENNWVREAALEAKAKFVNKLERIGFFSVRNANSPLADNDSKEQLLIGDMYGLVGKAVHLFRNKVERDKGIDGEIEFKNRKGKATGKMIYLQLKSGDSYIYQHRRDGKEIFYIKNSDHPKYWLSHNYPVFLVLRNSNGVVRWMNITDYLKQHGTNVKQIDFEGEILTPDTINRVYKELYTDS